MNKVNKARLLGEYEKKLQLVHDDLERANSRLRAIKTALDAKSGPVPPGTSLVDRVLHVLQRNEDLGRPAAIEQAMKGSTPMTGPPTRLKKKAPAKKVKPRQVFC